MSVKLSSAERGADRLATRRKSQRRRARIAFVILLVLLFAGIMYELNQPALRISYVTVYGSDQSFSIIALRQMKGTYLWIVPRDSTLLYPAGDIRSAIIAEHPEIAAVSIFRNGLNGLSIKTHDRVGVARWCGLAPTPDIAPYCYVFDANGFIFAAADSSTPPMINSFELYAPLVGNTLEPLRATLAHADKLPAAFDFARKFFTLGSPVSKIVFRGDEVDDLLSSGTRVTYVLGNEEDAYTALSSSSENFNLSDGSIDYIDLRFNGRVYVKKKGDTGAQ